MNELVAGRFEIEREAGAGGMARVFRARDRETNAIVALKIMHDANVDDARFEQEARTLAAIEDPGVVGYVAHGILDDGKPFLAMEWLDGEDLAERLARGPLTLDETMALAFRVATSLAALHARGIVHRDLKPSNVHLPANDIGGAKLLDFGIARRADATRITRTGMLVGTPAYMAPEQARASGDIDARVDVFALGCLLYECIAGVSAFPGDNALAVLARILVEDSTPLEQLKPEVPRGLGQLVRRMLAKKPEDRPRDGGEVLSALTTLDPSAPSSHVEAKVELRVAAIVLGGPVGANDSTLDSDSTLEAEARVMAEACGARFEAMANGAVLALFAGPFAAADLARAAATFALRSRTIYGGKSFVVAMGRANVAGPVPMGDAFDRAAAMLERSRVPGAILLDPSIAALLEATFDVRSVGGERELGEPRVGPEAVRQVLGRATPCVGRERDVARLCGLVDECFADRLPHAALITAPAGTGKSRLVDETLRAVRLRQPDATIAVARTNLVGGGSAFALVAELIRELDPRFEEVVTAALPAADARRTLAMLRDVAGQGGSVDEAVRAARSDPKLYAEAVRNAWLDALRCLCETAPVVLVCEDLHWADLPSVTLVDAALGRLGESPLFVFGTARPEIDTIFPGMWSKHALHITRLGALARRAGEQLVRNVLPDVTDDVMRAIVDRAAGHPFFLEEIVRAIAQGASPTVMPDTVLGTLQVRLDALDADERATLRAAAVFGERFWERGVQALVSPDIDVSRSLGRLAEADLVESATHTLVEGEAQWVLRHALVRDAAYALLPDAERVLAHGRAGAWLESRGYDDVGVLAEHYDRGGIREKALDAFERAARAATEAHDLARAAALVDRARAHAAAPVENGALDAIEAAIAHLRGDVAQTTLLAERALDRLVVGSKEWFRAVSLVITSAGQQGDNERVHQWALVASNASADDALGEQVVALARAVGQLVAAQDQERSEPVFQRLLALAPDPDAFPAHVAGPIHRAHAFHSLWSDSNLWRFGVQLSACLEACERANARADMLQARVLLAVSVAQRGRLEVATKEFRDILREAEAREVPYVRAFAFMELGLAFALHHRCEEALEALECCWEGLRGSERLLFHALQAASVACLELGRARDAVEHARHAASMKVNASLRAVVMAVEVEGLLALGEMDAALEKAREALALDRGAGWEVCEGYPELALTRALEARGDIEGARAAIASAMARLDKVLALAPDASERAYFLSTPTPNGKIVEAAKRLGVPWAYLDTVA